MQAADSNSIDQLLARAILDLEIKMKHEMRQNSALQLAKLEKHNQHMEKRIGIIEAKLEALLNRDSSVGPSSGGGNSGGNHSRFMGNRQSYHQGSRTPTYFSRTSSLANGNGVEGSGGRKQPNRMQSMTSPVHRAQPYGAVFASGGGGGSGGNFPMGRQQQQTPHGRFERKQQNRPKQTVGTGGNRAQLGEKPPGPPKESTWTTKVGIFTSGEESSDENGSRTASESGYCVAKPGPKGGEIIHPEEEVVDEEEAAAEGQGAQDAKEEEVDTKSANSETNTLKSLENNKVVDQEDNNNKPPTVVDETVTVVVELTSTAIEPAEAAACAVVESTTDTNENQAPAQVIGGFGRGRRN